MNKINVILTLNGKDVDLINKIDLESVFKDAGYSDNGIEEVKFLGKTQANSLVFLTLSYDRNVEEYYISRAYVSKDTADWEGMPIAQFLADEKTEAETFFNKYEE